MKQIKRFVLISLFIGLFQQAAAATDIANTDASMQKEILYHINKYRITHGMSMLKMNQLITQEATQHSRDMAQHKLPFGHLKYEQRMGRLFKNIKDSNGGAENVAYNYKTAEIVVSEWIKSPGHRQNIRGNYNLTGIGIARDERGRIYYTQMFVRSKSVG